MASRPELVALCKELQIDTEELDIAGMEIAIRSKIDEFYNKKKVLIGDAGKSSLLLRFMSTEYDYAFTNRKGQIVNYKGEVQDE